MVATTKVVKVVDDNVKQVTKPLARTGSNLTPMVALAMVALVLGTLVSRGAGPTPATPNQAPRGPRGPAEFRPLTVRPGTMKRRAQRDPIDPAVADALAAFEDAPSPHDTEPPTH